MLVGRVRMLIFFRKPPQEGSRVGPYASPLLLLNCISADPDDSDRRRYRAPTKRGRHRCNSSVSTPSLKRVAATYLRLALARGSMDMLLREHHLFEGSL